MNAISIIVPVFNEEQILVNAVESLIADADCLPFTYEVVLCENGSTDRTAELAEQLSRRHAKVRVIRLPRPSYGWALKVGIEHARYDRLVFLNLDLCDREFLARASRLLDAYDCVVGSKVLAGSQDERPWIRRRITRLFNGFLRLALGFQGTDTHGVKAFRRHRVLPFVRACATEAELFDTELVLRSHRAGLTWCEIPVAVRECRPARTTVVARAVRTIPELITLLLACVRRPETAEGAAILYAYDRERVCRLAQYFDVDDIVELTLIPRDRVEHYLRSAGPDEPWPVLTLAKLSR